MLITKIYNRIFQKIQEDKEFYVNQILLKIKKKIEF
jgi:hypothetical protein